MSTASFLSPEDDLFGRVAVHNKLVTGKQVEECTSFLVAEVAEGKPRLHQVTLGRGAFGLLSRLVRTASRLAAPRLVQLIPRRFIL